jgi:COP9 signalosome complex subunit 2
MSDEEDFLSEESYEFEFEEDEDDGVEENENHQDYGMVSRNSMASLNQNTNNLRKISITMQKA